MITRDQAIKAIQSVLDDASRRVTKPLRADAAKIVCEEALAAFDASPARFPTLSVLAKFVKSRTTARPSTEAKGQADPPADAKRRRVPTSKKLILEDMSPGSENA